MKISALIIDDDADSRLIIYDYISNKHKEIIIAGEAVSVTESVELVKKLKPDLLLLDISLPDGTGFDLLKKLDQKEFEVIFITGHNTFAIEAFKFSAVDYLLKPVAFTDLEIALQKVGDRLKEKYFIHHWSALTHNMQQQKTYEKRLAITTAEGFIFVEVKNIVRLESHSNYTHFYFSDGKKMVSSHTLGYYEELLPKEHFCRIHNSHLVNIEFIEKYKKAGVGGSIIMKDGTELNVSQRKKEAFLLQLVKKV